MCTSTYEKSEGLEQSKRDLSQLRGRSGRKLQVYICDSQWFHELVGRPVVIRKVSSRLGTPDYELFP